VGLEAMAEQINTNAFCVNTNIIKLINVLIPETLKPCFGVIGKPFLKNAYD
jgi:hypothetical protein